MPQIAIGSTVVPIQNPLHGPGINGINAGDNLIYVGPDASVNAQTASQTLQPQDVLNWPANESLYIVCDPGKVSIFQYSNNGAAITKGTVNTNIISGSVEIAGDVTLSGPVELATGSSVAISGDVTLGAPVDLAAGSQVAISGPVTIGNASLPITGNVGITSGNVNATITNATIDVAGNVVNQASAAPTLLGTYSFSVANGTGFFTIPGSFTLSGLSAYQTLQLVVVETDHTAGGTPKNSVQNLLTMGIYYVRPISTSAFNDYTPTWNMLGGGGVGVNQACGSIQVPIQTDSIILTAWGQTAAAFGVQQDFKVYVYGIATPIPNVKYVSHVNGFGSNALLTQGAWRNDFNGTNVTIPLGSHSGDLFAAFTNLSGTQSTIDLVAAVGAALDGANDVFILQTTTSPTYADVYVNAQAPLAPIYLLATGNGRANLVQAPI